MILYKYWKKMQNMEYRVPVRKFMEISEEKNMNVKNCSAYELLSNQKLENQNGTGYYLRHKKTGARVALIENQDDNKVFTIGFRTPPKDSTGAAHIVEHTVLCGSKHFPVKDPFIELAKGSLNTFLNAMTYPDKTVYPLASCNAKDFQNLMHVYLDAVFYPNIYKEEKIFRQEGWHYELEDIDAPLKYNGVVYNEMKGAYSSPDRILLQDISKSLFPDTPYGMESGGDPVDIPSLTYEQYLDFHRRYYHPSNSYIYLYGDMDMEEKLNWINQEYLSDFDYLEVDSGVPIQQPFLKPVEKDGFYSVTEGEQTEGKAYFSSNYVCGMAPNRELYQSIYILEHVLVKSVGAPLKQALLDAGIGSEIFSVYEESVKQPWFSIVAKDVRMEQKDEFKRIIKDTLTELVKNGLNKKSLLAAIQVMEFQYREADFGSYPKGLMYGLKMFDSWLYDESKPFLYIDEDGIFDNLRKKAETDYFEKLIQKYFLDNKHTSFVSIQPKVGLTGFMEKEERDFLDDYKKSLGKEELLRVAEETKALKRYQEEPTAPELLATIPLLARDDIGKEAKPYYNQERKITGCPVLFHDVFTNGINYLRLSFDVLDLKEYAPYISLLAEMIGFVDTDIHDKLELSNEILLHAGGMGLSISNYKKRKSGGFTFTLDVTAKMLYAETGYVLGLIREILTSSHVWDEKRLREVISEARADMQVSLQSAGHTTAAWRAMSYVSERAYYMEQCQGIAFYDFLCDMEENFEKRKENLVLVLRQLVKKIFVKQRLCIVSLTSDEKGYTALSGSFDELLTGLSEKEDTELPNPDWKLEKYSDNEGFKTAGKVQYVARAGNFMDKGISYDGSFKVIRTILRHEYLWNELRVKGGAYGAMCMFADEGIGYLVSYRDPHLAGTDAVYRSVPHYLENFEADEKDMTKYIIGTISGMDTPRTPREKGESSYVAYVSEVTFEDKQREREQVLAADQETVRKGAEMVRALLSDGCICALGGEEKVEQAKDMFQTVRMLV